MTRARETFDFDIKLAFGPVTLNEQGLLEVQGVIRHANDDKVDLAAAVEDKLRLGFRLLSGDTSEALIFEDRARFSRTLLEPKQLYNFSLVISKQLPQPLDGRLMMDFVYEAEYWFHERGRLPFIFRFRNDEGGATVLPLPSPDDPSLNVVLDGKSPQLQIDSVRDEEIYLKGDPALLPAMVDSLRSILERYGPIVAIEFAYLQILGRSADPGGLYDKSTCLSTGSQSLEEICAKMLGGEEYKARAVFQHRDPKVVIGSWAAINGVGTRPVL